MIDLRAGRAVRGAGGDRGRYRPVTSRLAGEPAADLSEPSALLSAYLDELRPDMFYVADLDRIEERGDNDAILRDLVERAPRARFLWDGGFSGAAALPQGLRDRRVLPVVGTETLRSIEELRREGGPGPRVRPVLSLDLRAQGVISRSALLASMEEEEILTQARRHGVRTVIVLLLDRVGTARGLPRDRLLRLRAVSPRLDLLAGGGIASLDDLEHLRDAGFSGALLATALHEGLIAPRDLKERGFIA